MAVHTVKILSDSGLFEHVLCATSANAPKTAKVLTDAGVQTVHTAGRGYSEDLGEVLESMQGKVLIISGDMPLLDLLVPLQDLQSIHVLPYVLFALQHQSILLQSLERLHL